MLEADRTFLADFVNLTFKNHMMAVEALLHAGGHAEEFAALYLQHENPTLTPQEAKALEQRTNERARFQMVMFGKIYAEYVAALEDFGAFCFAIQKRSTDGILSRYLRSETGDAAQFFDDVLSNFGRDLGTLLGLPDIASLSDKVAPETHALLTSNYAEVPKHIADVARAYRDPPTASEIRGLSSLSPNRNELVHIMVDAPGPAGRNPAKGLRAQAFNKIKHRFMMIESIEEYSKLPNASEYKAIVIEKDWPAVRTLFVELRRASAFVAEIAATIMKLDEAGVLT